MFFRPCLLASSETSHWPHASTFAVAGGWLSFQRLREEFCMRSKIILWCVSAVCFMALCAAPPAQAQGGEPQYFAIRGAKVVPVAGSPMENATIVIARGLLT